MAKPQYARKPQLGPDPSTHTLTRAQLQARRSANENTLRPKLKRRGSTVRRVEQSILVSPRRAWRKMLRLYREMDRSRTRRRNLLALQRLR